MGRRREALAGRGMGFFTKLILLVLILIIVGGGAFAAVLFLKPGLVPAPIRDRLRDLGLPVPEVTVPEGEAAPEGEEAEEAEAEAESGAAESDESEESPDTD